MLYTVYCNEASLVDRIELLLLEMKRACWNKDILKIGSGNSSGKSQFDCEERENCYSLIALIKIISMLLTGALKKYKLLIEFNYCYIVISWFFEAQFIIRSSWSYEHWLLYFILSLFLEPPF